MESTGSWVNDWWGRQTANKMKIRLKRNISKIFLNCLNTEFCYVKSLKLSRFLRRAVFTEKPFREARIVTGTIQPIFLWVAIESCCNKLGVTHPSIRLQACFIAPSWSPSSFPLAECSGDLVFCPKQQNLFWRASQESIQTKQCLIFLG